MKKKFMIYRQNNYILNKDKRFEKIVQYTISDDTGILCSKEGISELAKWLKEKVLNEQEFDLEDISFKTTTKASEYSLGSSHEVVNFPLSDSDLEFFKGEFDAHVPSSLL